MNPKTRKGSCLCGAVQVTATPKSNSVGACHCVMCRKWGGGPLLAAECGTAVSFEGSEQISIYNSSTWAERGFCRKCGTHLFFRLAEGAHYSIPVGLFDGANEWEFTGQVFIDQKPSFYSFAEKTKNLTKNEIFNWHAGE